MLSRQNVHKNYYYFKDFWGRGRGLFRLVHLIKTKLKVFSGAVYGPFFERQLKGPLFKFCQIWLQTYVMLQLREFYFLAMASKDIVMVAYKI